MSVYQTIPLKALKPSENNYRRSFDKAALEELVASVKSKGVLQPILVRPIGKKFEIVAGHRRHKAALAAGLKEMPAMVRDLTDEEALEVQVIENTQREDPNPMDEAVGFKHLLDMGRHTPETLAGKIGHSVKYVLTRTRLLGLCEDAQELVAAGELTLGHALLLSRLKNPADQKKMIEIINRGEGLTVRQAAERMDSFSMDLADADFNLGGCDKCMARTRNQADLFPALKDADDECMDRDCYYEKTLTHWAGWLEERRDEGFPVFYNDKEAVPQHGGREGSTARIVAALEAKRWNQEYPREYADRCLSCKEHHAFFVYEETSYGGHKSVEYGEICLNTECLDKMNRRTLAKGGAGDDDEDEDGNGTMGKCEKERLATDCLHRFLKREIVERMNLSAVLRKRVLISQLLELLLNDGDEEPFLKEFLPGFDPDAPELYEQDEAWRVLRALSPYRLDEAIEALIRHNISISHREVLDEMSKDAGVDKAGFAIDEEYLSKFSGQDLRELVAELWTDAVPLVLNDLLDACGDDETIRRLILTQEDLKGRLPKELVEAEEEENEEKAEDRRAGEPLDEAQEGAEGFDDEDATPTAPETDPSMPQTTQTGKKSRGKAS